MIVAVGPFVWSISRARSESKGVEGPSVADERACGSPPFGSPFWAERSSFDPGDLTTGWLLEQPEPSNPDATATMMMFRATNPTSDLARQGQRENVRAERKIHRVFARTIVLLGSRGAGKSSVSVALARELGVPAIDLDREIQAVSGKEISRIFQEDGEARFRDLEERALRDALARGTPCVVSPGGGVVLREKNR